ncbi:HAD family phosphatase [Alkalibacter rhizosphaerae]|uniref:HAD family phosphatase n=1 Tax=Alkalibacter rhizosphaerae TaxID=2815577 RepID=A0A975AJ11_9FIRM|nr:Cof-type HAD-IIB family hydrolase [Alkalibacter rhizosphaerae]QSX09234.1 HAD family phosphatase [Alkalibacter rhizosphaerae]
MIKLIAIDIDGTLVDYNQSEISRPVKFAIRKARDLGIEIVLISGRNYYSMKKFVSELNLHGAALTINGGVVVNTDQEKIMRESIIPSDVVEKMLKILDQDQTPRIVFSGLALYVEPKYAQHETVRYLMKEKDNVLLVEDMFIHAKNNNVNKIMAMTQNEKIAEIIDKIKPISKGILNMERGLDNHVDIYPSSTSKGASLAYVAKQKGIDKHEVMAIGDAETDISMLLEAGVGVAMGNSLSSVCKHADFITKPVWEDGVAHAIETFILKDR